MRFTRNNIKSIEATPLYLDDVDFPVDNDRRVTDIQSQSIDFHVCGI